MRSRTRGSTRSARRRAGPRWPGSGLPIGLRQPRLANALLRAQPAPGNGPVRRRRRNFRAPTCRSGVRRPGRWRRPPRPVRTAKTAASARRPRECCGRSAAPPSPSCSIPGGRSRSRPTAPCATGRSAACHARSGRPRRPTLRRSATGPSRGKIVRIRRAMAEAKR